MTALDRLDNEMDRWEQELTGIEQQSEAGERRHFQALTNKMQQMRRQLQQLERLIEHTRLAEATELAVAPQLRAILFWAREFAERIEDFGLRYSDYLSKLLWLNLLRGRLLGHKKPFQLDISEADINAMLNRKHSLEQSEQLLAQELSLIQARERELRANYDNFHYEEVSRQAAQSFASSNYSSQKTTLEAFGRLLRTVSAHAAHENGQVKKMQRLTVTFTKRSQGLMEECSELLRQGMSSQGSQRRRTARLMQQSLKEMQRLEAEIDTSLTVLQPGSERRNPALIVKKAGKQATTIRLSISE